MNTTYSMKAEREKLPSGLTVKETNRRNFMVLADGKGAELLVSYQSLVAMRIDGVTWVNKAYTRPYASGKGLKACSPTTGKHLSKFGAFGALDELAVDADKFGKVAATINSALPHLYNVRGEF